jgi:polyisoprenoid-binding protein YceI
MSRRTERSNVATTTTIPRQRSRRSAVAVDTGLPKPGLWVLDPTDTTVGFTGKASRLAPTVSARFAGVTGSVLVRRDVTASEVDVEVDLTTMSSGNRAWDELVAAVDPFEIEDFPGATYRSSAVHWHGDRADVVGELTLHGVTRPVRLTARHSVSADGERLTLTAEGSVDRSEFGIRCDLPGAALLIPRRMTLQIAVEASFSG